MLIPRVFLILLLNFENTVMTFLMIFYKTCIFNGLKFIIIIILDYRKIKSE